MPAQEEYVLPSQETLRKARSTLLTSLPAQGIGFEQAQQHLRQDIVPALNGNSKSPRYYGFVTGGATPIATFADKLAVEEDQNVQVHLPDETVATNVEDAALRMLCELLGFDPSHWPHRTFTTGATASNVVGLACGREYVVAEAAKRAGVSASIARDGLLEATRAANIHKIQILTTVPHSSLRKAASILGLGHASVIDVSSSPPTSPHHFSHSALTSALATPNTASIIAISAAEVNTGLFATTGLPELTSLRALADTHGAWIHVDAAFGLQARLLLLLPETNPSYSHLTSGVAGLELADSITGDAHKMLNVPYDCGFILTKNLSLAQQVFQNPSAAYLDAASSGEASIPSPLNIGIENSRRFRALPVYASLAAHGRAGYVEILERQIRLARAMAAFVWEHPAYELLPLADDDSCSLEDRLARIYVIVIFRARDEKLNSELVKRMNGTRKLYVSGTKWEGKAAARFAVANWQVDVDRDLAIVKEVLEEVCK
jgi:glutamate/tyrosine decarboxylase-like PLP-dependent enzyme